MGALWSSFTSTVSPLSSTNFVYGISGIGISTFAAARAGALRPAAGFVCANTMRGIATATSKTRTSRPFRPFTAMLINFPPPISAEVRPNPRAPAHTANSCLRRHPIGLGRAPPGVPSSISPDFDVNLRLHFKGAQRLYMVPPDLPALTSHRRQNLHFATRQHHWQRRGWPRRNSTRREKPRRRNLLDRPVSVRSYIAERHLHPLRSGVDIQIHDHRPREPITGIRVGHHEHLAVHQNPRKRHNPSIPARRSEIASIPRHFPEIQPPVGERRFIRTQRRQHLHRSIHRMRLVKRHRHPSPQRLAH